MPKVFYLGQGLRDLRTARDICFLKLEANESLPPFDPMTQPGVGLSVFIVLGMW